MTHLPEDVLAALETQPGLIRQYALEQALKYAQEASRAVDSKSEQAPRAHVIGLANVSQAWSEFAEALRIP